MQLVEKPYRHYIIQNFFHRAAFGVLNDFAAAADWQFFEDKNFPQFISQRKAVEHLFLENMDTKAVLSYVFSRALLNELQNLFSCSLERCVSISFHKLTEGCFNVVHNDANTLGEKIRVVCYLTEPGNYEGGELNLFSLEDQKTPAISYKLPANTAFVFAMTEPSVHSVSRVTAGERICLVLTYK